MSPDPWGLYLISDEAMVAEGSFAALARHALEAGVRVVQLRAKTLSDEVFLRAGREIRDLTRAAGTDLIVNDRPDLALALEADGVHLGQADADPREARRLLGPERLIGWSTHNRAQIEAAQGLPVDYIGIGPVFATETKADAGVPTGPALLAWAVRHCTLPIVAIGGITLGNLDEVLRTGVRNVAVISAISRAADPSAAVREFVRRIRSHRPRESHQQTP